MENEWNALQVEIPKWYRPFIRFMPNFYKEIPEQESACDYWIRVDMLNCSFSNPITRGKEKGGYEDIQTAYLKVRWRALWIDVWTVFSGKGVQWVIIKKINRNGK